MEKMGKVFDIYRGTTHDGPGMRTTIFMKGCPLHCRWCHNPEGISAKQIVWWDERVCIGCMTCRSACKYGALDCTTEGIKIHRDLCQVCGSCVKACPTKAMSFVCEEWTVDRLVHEALKDRVYYDQTGGGVTVSGGEALLQADFVAELFEHLWAEKIHTALDTCGHAPTEKLDLVLRYTNTVLYDLKIVDPVKHRKMTGVENDLILQNAEHLANLFPTHNYQFDIWIRTPLIPDATISEENIAAIALFIKNRMENRIVRWEMCSFNNSCINKYNKLGLDWEYQHVQLLARSKTNQLLEIAKEANPEIADRIFVTGIIRED